MGAVLALAACGSSSSSSGGSRQQLKITAKDFSLALNPNGVQPGQVDISALNSGKQPHGVLLGRLKDGVTIATVRQTIVRDPAKALAMFTLAGGTPSITPGAPWKATTTLHNGTYVAVDTGTGTDGKANFTKPGEIQTFDVKGQESSAPAAKNDATVDLHDYAIDMPASIPATASLRIRNSGADNHELTFVKVHSPSVGAKFVDLIKSGKAVDFKSATIPALAPTGPGTETTVEGRLKPGYYLAYCAFASARSKGKAHAVLGMTHVFQVKG